MRTLCSSWRVATPAALLLLASCFRLSRDTPRVQYFVLGGTAPPSVPADTLVALPRATAADTPDTDGLTLGLRRIDLASYLAVPAIVQRRGAHQVAVSEFHRWGEDLGEGINRVVAAYLAHGPSVRAVAVAPWAARARHDFLLQIHVSRFEGVADSASAEGRSHLVASWDIIRPLDGRLLVRGRTEALEGPWRVGDYAGVVSGLDATLVRLARDINSCLSRFPNDSTPPARCDAGAAEQPARP